MTKPIPVSAALLFKVDQKVGVETMWLKNSSENKVIVGVKDSATGITMEMQVTVYSCRKNSGNIIILLCH